MRKLVFFIGCIFQFHLGFTQLADPLHVEIFDTHDGLLSTEVLALHQDQNGFLWVGTSIGLSRYDGYEFKNFTPADGLTKGKVIGIEETEEGHLWIATEKGITYYDQLNFREVKYRNDPVPEFLFEIHLVNQQELWVGSNRGVGRLKKDHWNTALINADSSYFERIDDTTFVSLIRSDGEGNIYLGGFNYLFRYDTPHWDTIGIGDPGIHDFFYSIHFLENGKLLTGTRTGNFYQFDSKGRSLFIPPDPTRSDIYNIIPHNDEFWAVHQDGILKIYPDRTHVSHSLYDHYDIKMMYCMLKDREDNFWLGSNEGLIRLSPRDFRLYPEMSEAMPNGIFSIGENEDGELFLGSNHGIVYSKNPTQSTFTRLPLPPHFPGAEIVGILFDKNDNMWLPTFWDGICRVSNNQLHKYWYEDGFYLGADIAFGGIDTFGNIWLGHNYGLSKMQSNGPGQYFFTNYPSLEHIGFNTYHIDAYQQVWLGSEEGLFFVSKNDAIQQFQLPVNDLPVRGITSDSHNHLWIATLGKGVYQYEITGPGQLQLVNAYDLEDGLSSNFLLDAEADDLGNIWLGTYLGISVLRKKDRAYFITNYDPKDGLIEKAYQKIILHKDKQGVVWAATSMGLMSFDPRQIHFNEVEPALNVDYLKINGEAFSLKNLTDAGLKLPYYKNDLEIGILGISLKNSQKNKYQIKLEGGRDEWSVPTSQRVFAFNNLSPGEYTFSFKGSNNDLVWSSTPLNIPIYIRPPFWTTWWFYALTILITGVGVVYYVKRREQQLKEKEREQGRISKMIAELETRALRAQMNPHFIFNSLNAIQESIITEQVDVAYSYLQKFSRLLRNVLDSSSKSYIKIEKEVEILNLYLELESLRFDDQFEYQISMDNPKDEIEELYIPSLMVQPFVENAIWHGLMQKKGARKVNVHFTSDAESVKCSIKDNGIGRVAAQKISRKKRRKHNSMALQLIKDRLELIKQQNEKATSIRIIDLYDDRLQAIGTEVNIKVPNDLIPENPN